MKKAKFLMLAVAAVTIALGVNSCSDDTDSKGAPTISIDASSSTQVSSAGKLTITGEVTAPTDAEIDEIKVVVLYKTGDQENEAVVAADKSAAGITKENSAKYTFRFTETSTGIKDHLTDLTGIRINASVKDGDPGNRTFNITAQGGGNDSSGTNLSAATAFTLGRPEASGFPATAMGITWSSNSDATTAVFTVSAGVVILANEAAYNAITTQAQLTAAFTGSVTTFSAKSDAAFTAKYLIVKDGTTLRLVKMTNLTFAAGANKAYFTEKH